MTKNERLILSEEISRLIKDEKGNWQDLKEEIYSFGYQDYYPTQNQFEYNISCIIDNLSKDEKSTLINEWKNRKERIQFKNDEEYLHSYKLYVMEELVSRATKATHYM